MRVSLLGLLALGLPLGLPLGLLGGCHRAGPSPAPIALQIASQRPTPSSVAEVDAVVALVFDREPDPATLVPGALQVTDGSGPLPGASRYNAALRTWTWIAARELPRGALLTVRVADTVRGLDGASLAAGSSWTFRVRAGVPAPLQTFANGATAVPFVGLRADGTALVVAGGQSFEWSGGTFRAPESLPTGTAIGLHIDAAGNAAVLTSTGSSTNLEYWMTRRAPAAAWSSPVLVAGPAGVELAATLVGNERGDLLVHSHFGMTSPTRVIDRIHWAGAAAPDAWQQLMLPSSFVWYGRLSTLDGAGRIATLHRDGNFLLAERRDPAVATLETYTIAQATYLQVRGFGAASEGTLRAIWTETGGTNWQRRIAADGAVEPTAAMPLFVPAGTVWRTAKNGAIVGWNGTTVYRSEAGSADWRSAQLFTEPLAAAISPRGEAVFVYFRLPDQLLLVRWRAGENIDPPLLVGAVSSPFAALREVAPAVDDTGRVVLIFRPESPGELIGIRIE